MKAGNIRVSRVTELSSQILLITKDKTELASSDNKIVRLIYSDMTDLLV